MKQWLNSMIGIGASGGTLAVMTFTSIDPYVRTITGVLGGLVTLVSLIVGIVHLVDILERRRDRKRR